MTTARYTASWSVNQGSTYGSAQFGSKAKARKWARECLRANLPASAGREKVNVGGWSVTDEDGGDVVCEGTMRA